MTNTTPKTTEDLTPEELALVQRHREEKAIAEAKQVLRLEALKVAAEFAKWSAGANPAAMLVGLSFSTFCDSFGYEMDDRVAEAANVLCNAMGLNPPYEIRRHIHHVAVHLIREAQLLSSKELEKSLHDARKRSFIKQVLAVPVAGKGNAMGEEEEECILTREQIKEISRGVDPEFLLANEPEVE